MCRGLVWRWLLDLRPLPRAGTQQGPSSPLLLPPGSSSSRWSAGGTHNLESPRDALARLFPPASGGGKRVSCWGVDFCPFGCQLLPARPSPPAAPRSQQGWGMAPGAAPQKCHRILLPASHTRGCPRSSLLPVTEAKVVVDRVGGGIRNNRCMGSDCCFCPSSASSFRWSGDVWQGIYLRVWLFCISALVIKSQAA